jgi:hypothetical protein
MAKRFDLQENIRKGNGRYTTRAAQSAVAARWYDRIYAARYETQPPAPSEQWQRSFTPAVMARLKKRDTK